MADSIVGTLENNLNSLVKSGVSGVSNFLSTVTQRTNSQYNTVQTTVFPGDLIDATSSRAYFMSFTFYQYQRPSIFQTPFANPQGTIILPLPSQLIDAQSINYKEADFHLNPAIGAALDAQIQVKNSGQSTISQLQNDSTAFLEGLATGGASNLINALGQIFGVQNATALALQTEGVAINPYDTILFTSPTFKRHTFSWIFTATNQTESNTLKYIINKFRYHQLPDTNQAAAGTLLQYPDLVLPVITPAGYMYSFKYCVIESAEVNYAPGQTPGFYATTNAPISIGLTLRLLEIEYWLKSDLAGNTLDPNYTIPGVNTINIYNK
jgi:hypothetical protein